MTRTAYIPGVPVIEDGGGVFLIHLGEGHESLALTPHTFELFLEAGRRAVLAWHTAQSNVVTPFPGPARRTRSG